jgi:hypothetical protein
VRCAVLLYGAEELWASASPAQREGFALAHADFDEAVRRGGDVVASGALTSGVAATTVRLADGVAVLHAGPAAGVTGDLGPVGGVYLVDVPELDALVAAATLLPDYTVEIRPLIERPVTDRPLAGQTLTGRARTSGAIA